MAKPPTLTERMERVEAALSLSPMKPKTNFWGWVQANSQLSIVLAVLTLFVAGIGVWVAILQLHQPERQAEAEAVLARAIDKEMEAKLNPLHLEQLAADVNIIKGQMTEITPLLQTVVTKEMQHAAALSLPEFERNLQQVKTDLTVAKITGAQTTPNVTDGIQARLVKADRQQPAYWSAASAFVNYQYLSPARTLPPCDHPFRSTLNTVNSSDRLPHEVRLGGAYTFMDCTLNLDVQISFQAFGPPSDTIECRRCLVIYNGGDVPLFHGGIRKMLFKDCTFNVDATEKSPVEGKDLIATVLSAKDRQAINYLLTTG